MSKTTGLTKRVADHARADAKEIWLIDSTAERGGGRLLLRVHPSGTKNFYFRYFVDRRAHLVPMGPYASDPTLGKLTLEQARSIAREYAAVHRNVATRNVRDFLHHGFSQPQESSGDLAPA